MSGRLDFDSHFHVLSKEVVEPHRAGIEYLFENQEFTETCTPYFEQGDEKFVDIKRLSNDPSPGAETAIRIHEDGQVSGSVYLPLVEEYYDEVLESLGRGRQYKEVDRVYFAQTAKKKATIQEVLAELKEGLADRLIFSANKVEVNAPLSGLLKFARPQGVTKDVLLPKIQAKHKQYLQSGDVRGSLWLYQITGVKPNVTEEFVNEVYQMLAKDKDETEFIFAVKTLSGMIETEVAGKIVQEQYSRYLKSISEGAIALHHVEELMESTNIKPELPEEEIQNAYAKLAQQRRYRDLERLKNVTGVKPKLPEDVVQGVQELYRGKLAEDFNGNLIHLGELAKASGLRYELPADVVQQKYSEFISTGMMGLVAALADLTGTRASADLVNRLCVEKIREGDLCKTHSALVVTEVEPQKEVYKQFLEYLEK